MNGQHSAAQYSTTLVFLVTVRVSVTVVPPTCRVDLVVLVEELFPPETRDSTLENTWQDYQLSNPFRV